MIPPLKKPNLTARSREYLTGQEVEAIRKAAKQNSRNGHRNDTLILMMFRHALRVSEAVTLRWEQVDLTQGLLHVQRIKKGIPATHPLQANTIRALRELKRSYPPHTSFAQNETPP
jgi:type 1 fimbriae regulatory protein FimE